MEKLFIMSNFFYGHNVFKSCLLHVCMKEAVNTSPATGISKCPITNVFQDQPAHFCNILSIFIACNLNL